MSNLDDQTLEILAGLNAAQPLTQQVDYSGFMRNFQPVLNDPNLFVPQQGLLQNTPVLDTLSDLDVMQQRPPVVMDMLNQYPTLERDFQRSFAVSPDTFNMNVYQPLPYNAALYQGLVNQGGSTSGGIDLTGLGAAGLLGAGAVSLLGGGGDDDDNVNDDTNETGGSTTGGITTGGSTTGGTTTGGATTGVGTVILGSDDGSNETDNTIIKDDITVGGVGNTVGGTLLVSSSDDNVDGSTNDNTIIKDDITVGGGGSTINGTGNNTIINTDEGSSDSADGSTDIIKDDTTTTVDGSGYITQYDANNIIQSLIDSNDISLTDAASLVDTINNTSANFGTALVSGLTQIKGSSTAANNLITKAQTGVSSSLANSLSNTSLANSQFGVLDSVIGSSNAVNLDGALVSLDGKLSGLSPTGISGSGASSFGSYFDEATGEYFTQILDSNNNLVWTKELAGNFKVNEGLTLDSNTNTLVPTKVADVNLTVDANGNLLNTGAEIVSDPRPLFDRIKTGISDFLTNPINEGFGTVGSALNDATQLTGAETLSLIGAGLSGLDAIEEGNISNVYNTGAGLGASGLLGGTAFNYAPISATATTAAVPVGGAAKGIQGLATSPAAIALGTILAIAQGLAPPSSGKTGSGAYDYNTSTNTEFGMAGDKFKQGHVDTASAISQGIGQAVNTIAEGYGLNVEGDHLVEFGRERPLNVTFGDTDEEQTNTNRLNYSPETGDILNTNEDITRLYYTGAEGNDGSALASNVIRGTNLLSLKAIANDEDTINMKDFKVPALSENDAKNRYLSMGLDENAANMLTSTSQQANTETISLLGSLIIPNTTNEDLFLTDAEKTSLLDKGYTEEQLNQILYG